MSPLGLVEAQLGLAGLDVLGVGFGLLFPGAKSVVVTPVLELVPCCSVLLPLPFGSVQLK